MTSQVEQTVQNVNQLLLAAGFVQLSMLGARTLPLLMLACFPTRQRFWSALGFCAVVALLGSWLVRTRPALLGQLGVVLAVLAYYLTATVGSYWLSRGLSLGTLRKDVLFCTLALVFVFAPAALLRRLGQIELLTVGWHVSLSIYSYCIEALRPSRRVPLSAFLFFVLVDPTVSFPDRARAASSSTWNVARRIGQGSALMMLGYALMEGWTWLLRLITAHEGDATRILVLSLAAVVAFFSMYWVKAGVAHVRIGLMQTLGRQTPECFDHPYLASSPLDFWRRWNRWVGDWVRRYLFAPLALYLARRAKTYNVSSAGAQGIAVLGAFAAMGVLHDWLIFANLGVPTFVYLRVFGFAAFGLLVWEAVATQLRGMQRIEGNRASIRWATKLGAAGYVSAMLAIAGRI